MRATRRGVFVSGTMAACLLAASPLFAESDSKTVKVFATILPRLELSVQPETGEQIVFSAVEQPAPGDERSQSVTVHLNVFSNLGRPYQVTQLIRRPLTSGDGQTIPDDQFQVSARPSAHGLGILAEGSRAGARDGAGLGQVEADRPVPVLPGIDTPLYTSNERGKSDRFSADYILTVTPQTPAGEYDTEIVYTVTSL